MLARGDIAPANGPCQLCGDPDVPVEYHDEDYSKPYLWAPPAMYALCRHCHRDKLHKRFSRPTAWTAFIAHVRRGGYARDMKDAEIKRELAAYQAAHERGESLALRPLRPHAQVADEEWFAKLRMAPESLIDPSARPRP